MWTRDRGNVDVTASTTWVAADSNLSDGLTPTAIATVTAPGVIVPLAAGNIAIHVRSLDDHQVAPHTYAVAQGSSAIALAPYLMGLVSEADGATPIANVRAARVCSPLASPQRERQLREC
jgi:hypothetical protein